MEGASEIGREGERKVGEMKREEERRREEGERERGEERERESSLKSNINFWTGAEGRAGSESSQSHPRISSESAPSQLRVT